MWFPVPPTTLSGPHTRTRTHATHLVVLGTVAEDQTHVRYQLPRTLVVLGVLHLKLLLHQFQVHGSLDDLVVVGNLEDAEAVLRGMMTHQLEGTQGCLGRYLQLTPRAPETPRSADCRRHAAGGVHISTERNSKGDE